MDDIGVKVKSIKIGGAEFEISDKDKEAAWELYVELITRTVTQELEPDKGDEEEALESIHKIFSIVREISRKNGPQCIKFTRISVIVINRVLRGFVSKWHLKFKNGILEEEKLVFREELKDIQSKMRKFTYLLAEMCNVEDITDILETDIEKR